MTFPASESQDPGQSPRSYPGVYPPNATSPTDLHEVFSEGLNIGYRWYQAHSQRALFPFGFGLTYTRFSYSQPRVSQVGGGAHVVYVTVTNRGRDAGAAVPQLYLHYPQAAGEPDHVLKGYAKIA